MSAAFNIMAVKGGPSNVKFTFCEYLNISICPISETGEVRIVYCVMHYLTMGHHSPNRNIATIDMYMYITSD